MSQPDGVRWFRWDDLPKEQLTHLLARRLITGDRVMLAHVYLKKGCVVPRHAHVNEQFTYVLDGALRFLIGETGAREVVVRTGEVLDLDVFYPPRQDWLDKTDDYLRGGTEPAR